MKIVPTTAELRQEVRQQLQCPTEFVNHLAHFKTLDRLQESIAEGDRTQQHEIMMDIHQEYRDFCHDTGLNFDEDNRKARIGFFFN